MHHETWKAEDIACHEHEAQTKHEPRTQLLDSVAVTIDERIHAYNYVWLRIWSGPGSNELRVGPSGREPLDDLSRLLKRAPAFNVLGLHRRVLLCQLTVLSIQAEQKHQQCKRGTRHFSSL